MKCRRAWLVAAAFGAAVAGCSNNSWSSGDRVLVSKIQYESGIKQPSRFDVVVFKYPVRSLEDNTPKNYIKRLLGLPGEILALFFGQLFRYAPPGEGPPFDDHQRPEVNLKTLWEKEFMHVNHERSRSLFDEGRFDIIRKTPDVMMAMRRIVYDNDFPPKDPLATPRWAPAKESKWTPDKSHGFQHLADKSNQIDWVRYQHLTWFKSGEPLVGNRAVKPELITDFMAYNSYATGGNRPPSPSLNWVGDLMLECQVQATKAEGEFWLELSKGIHRFRAKWDLGSGMCTLYKLEFRDAVAVELDSKPTKLRGPGTYQVRFANIDARLTVWVDKELPFGDGKDYPPPEMRNLPLEKGLDLEAIKQRRGPTTNDLEPASIGVKDADVRIHHLKLWRDTYYTLTPGGSDVSFFKDSDWSDPDKWGEFQQLNFRTLYVQPGHFLCLGDNSQQSSDSRDWGLVPERLMLGRALMVYYPFQRAGPIR